MSKNKNSNKYIWKRLSKFKVSKKNKETWALEHREENYEFFVNTYFGKKIDISRIKKDWPFQREIDLTNEKFNFFKDAAKFNIVDHCPVCNSKLTDAIHYLTICNVDYLECSNCSHIFSDRFPKAEVAEEYYKENIGKNTYYINPDEIELRVNEIYLPKIEWIIKVYEEKFNRRPKTILDIGAGSGHFLYACKKGGLEVYGVEFNKNYINWCKDNFDIDLCNSIETVNIEKPDIICSFNVIEHAVNPEDFIDDYKKLMGKESLAIIETPKVNSFGTGIQEAFPSDPRGMLVPYEHNHLFTDVSLATLLFKCGLSINSIWYFGQDMSELIMRICHENNSESSEMMQKLFPKLQQHLDSFRASNLMIVAGTLL
ncbi:MAG: methyltransferase domain-containing protein [Desulfobacterales bacterium]|nr:methyltransferase domain-containing protein [Desulfobacterales bacterium]